MYNTRGHNAFFLIWDGLPFPNNLQPARGEPEITFKELFARLARNGVNRLRVQFCGRNHVLGTDALSFEPLWGQFNDWNGQLTEAAAAALEYGITFQPAVLDNRELKDGWFKHGWNSANGGFLDDSHDIFTDPTAIDSMKARIDAIIDAIGPSISAWEIVAEMPWIITPAWWGLQKWVDLEPIIYDVLCPWVRTMAEYIHSVHSAPVGNGHCFSSKRSFDPDVDPISNLRCEPFRVDGLDFTTCNWYNSGEVDPVSNKFAWLRACREYAQLPVRVVEYAPWSANREVPYTREPPDFCWSKEHEWAAVCGEVDAAGPLRWLEVRPTDDYDSWWGCASPQMAEIAGTTWAFGDLVHPERWGYAEPWEDRLSSPDLLWAAACGDGQRATAFVEWRSTDPHSLTVEGLQDGEAGVYYFDWLAGDQVAFSQETVEDGVLRLEAVPQRDLHSVLYIAQDGTPPPPPPPPPPERRLLITVHEFLDDELATIWNGELTAYEEAS